MWALDDVYDRNPVTGLAQILPKWFVPEIRILRELYTFVCAELELPVKVTAVPAGIDAGKKTRPYRSIAKTTWRPHLRPRAIAPQTLQYRHPTGIATLCEQRGIGRIQTYEKDFWWCNHENPPGQKKKIRAKSSSKYYLV
jgi:hypothetical protein